MDIPNNLESSQFLEDDKWIERKEEVAEIACKRGTKFVEEIIEENKKKNNQKKIKIYMKVVMNHTCRTPNHALILLHL
jgi:hypothetical protein